MQDEMRIGIVGGGPGGLTLARILATRGIAATVFELDEHPLARPQGGSLDLHADSGQRALREAGLAGEFLKVARYDDQGDAVYDHRGVLQFEHDGAESDRPEIDRTQLRALLLASLPDGTVRWGSKVAGVEPLAGGRWRVTGEAGGLGDFDLVVGADGAWSRVRPLVSAARPEYLGIACVELRIEDVDRRHPAVAALIPRGKVAAVGADRGFIAQRSSGGQVRVYVMLRVPEAQAATVVDVSSPARAREQLRAWLPGWAPELLGFVDACEDTIVVRPIVGLPVGHRWRHRAGVTLLGDAAHVMSPFSGEGVNMAMLDGLELGLRLAAGGAWDAAVIAYEAEMFARAAGVAAGANEAARTWPAQMHELIALGGHEAAVGSRSGATPGALFATRIAAKTRDVRLREQVKAVYRFELSGPNGGTWIVDFTERAAGVRQGDEQAACTVTMTDADFVAMLAGDFTPRMGFMRGKVKIRGDMGLAMKLGEVIAG